jgi:hypothetical protein
MPSDEQARLRESIASRTASAVRDDERDVLEEMAENLGL